MTTWQWLIGFVALGLGGLLGLWAYGHLPVKLGRGWRFFLGTLRALAFAALFWLLAQPFYRHTQAILQRPRILFLADASASLFWGDSLTPDSYRQKLEQLADKLTERGFVVEKLLFDIQLRPWSSRLGTQEGTALHRSLLEAYQSFPQTEVIVLFSDGRNTHEPLALPPLPRPLWTVGVGPSPLTQDAAIRTAYGPSWVETGQPFEVHLQLENLRTNATLIVQYAGQTRNWPLPANATSYRLQLTLPESGFYPLNFRLETPNDPNPANNTYTAIVQVHPTRPHILLWAGELTPDIALLRRSLERVGPTTLLLAKRPSGFNANPDTLAWDRYAIHVLYNFPVRAEDTFYVRRILAGPGIVWTVWGTTVSEALIKAFQTPLGWRHLEPLYSFPLSGEARLLLRRGELAPQAELLEGPGGRPWAYRYTLGNHATAGLLGEGWWQLRLMPPLQASFDSLLFELAQWSLLYFQSRAFIQPKRSPGSIYEPIEWIGQYPAGAKLRICQPNGVCDTLSAPFGIWKPANGGLHSYALLVDNQPIYQGALWIQAQSVEFQQLGVDTTYLRYLSERHQGLFWLWAQVDSLSERLVSAFPPHTLVHLQPTTIPLSEWWPWLLLILALLSIEWLLRRYLGLY